MAKKQQKRSRCLGVRALSVVLSLLMVFSALAVLATVTATADATISNWFVSSSLNEWPNSFNNSNAKIYGNSGGSVTVNATTAFKFKMVADTNEGLKWCGIKGSVALTKGEERELEWNSGDDISYTPSQGTTQVTFHHISRGGKNYVKVTDNGTGGTIPNKCWYVSGNFNNWPTEVDNTTLLNSSGKVTVPINYFNNGGTSSFKFKMVYIDDTPYWYTCNSSLQKGVEKKIWTSASEGDDMTYAPSSGATSVTFSITQKGSDYYLTVTDDGSGGGTGTGDNTPMTYSAKVNTNNDDNTGGDIFWATATYFDYLSDEELTKTRWLQPIQAGTNGDPQYDGAIDEWYPFYLLNREVVKAKADADSNWALPLYFGNFCNVDKAYNDHSHHQGLAGSGFTDATNSSNVTRFWYAPNNSNHDNVDHNRTWYGPTSQNDSYQGLMSDHLSPTKQLLLPDGAVAPYFDADQLTHHAKVVNSQFPFRIAEKNGYTSYEFNSNDAIDNVYFTWATEDGITKPVGVNYGAGKTYGVVDGYRKFMGQEKTAEAGKEYQGKYGIFPFNNSADTPAAKKGVKTYANENLNYGFGIRIDVNFRVPKPNTNGVNTASNPIKFEFAGDDDLWMYITNNTTGESQLVLDMGGAHCMSVGSVNFFNRSVNVTHKYSDDHNKNSQITDDKADIFSFNYDDTYTMTVFYMERGLIESNMKMSFTMTPAGNQVTVDKTVNTAEINSNELQQAVAAAAKSDSFSFTAYEKTADADSHFDAKSSTEYVKTGTSSGGSYSYNGTTGSDGSFKLSDGEKASFMSKFTTNNVVQIEESDSTNGGKNKFSYTTQWSVKDPQDNNRTKALTDGTSADEMKLAKFPDCSKYDYAELNYSFVNTPQTGSVSITKTTDTTDMDFLGHEFGAKIEVKLPGGSYAAYPLEYYYTDDCTSEEGPCHLGSDGKLNSGALLKSGRTITIAGLPVNATVKVTEELGEYASLYNVPSITGNEVKVGADTVAPITITNTPLPVGSITGEVSGKKKFDFEDYTGGLFRFALKGIRSLGGSIDTRDVQLNTTTVSGGDFTISGLRFDRPGIYRYIVYEDMSKLEETDTDNAKYAEDSGDDSYRTTYHDDIYKVGDNYLVEINVTKSGITLNAEEPKYIPYAGAYEDITLNDFSAAPSADGMVFKNFAKDGSIKINKTNQANEPVNGVEFAVYKLPEGFTEKKLSEVTDEAYNTYEGLQVYGDKKFFELSAEERYDAVKALGDSAIAGRATTDDLKNAETDDVIKSGYAEINFLHIYRDGYKTSDAPEYQEYCFLEYDVKASGTNLNKTIEIDKTVDQHNIFSFPELDKDGVPQYSFTFDYINGVIKNPETAGEGMMAFKLIGLCIACLGALALAGYMICSTKASKRKYKHFTE